MLVGTTVRSAVPRGFIKRIEFERERLTNAVKRVALLSNERSRSVKFQLDKGKVEVTSSTAGSDSRSMKSPNVSRDGST